MLPTTLKEEKTFDEQIDLLESRGLVIEDREKAKFILGNVNYYRFSAYLINFKNKKSHEEFVKHFKLQKSKNSNKAFIKHHNEKYDGNLPIWVAVEIITFGSLAKLYSILLPRDKNFIKHNSCKVNPKLIESWLQKLSTIRNHCAHFGRLYNTNFSMMSIPKKDAKYNIKNNKVFAYILAMKYLVADRDIWNEFFINLQELIQEYNKVIDLELLGFPKKWISILSQ